MSRFLWFTVYTEPSKISLLRPIYRLLLNT